MENNHFCKLGLSVIETEAQAIQALSRQIDERFSLACQTLLNCEGRIVVTGMGKSGHIANKIAATLASTGSPAFFMHPGEANHGDLGMITRQDVIIALSYSGNTEEILSLLPLIKRFGLPLITLTGNPASPLAQAANINIDVSVSHEACPLGLAPTTSTTAALVMGDALAVALLDARGFTSEDFARSHPGGRLGRQLLLRISDLPNCHRDAQIPIVHQDATISEALIEVTQKQLGMTCVVNQNGELTGIFTDGDVRRSLNQNLDIHQTPIHQVMTHHPHTIQANILACEALKIMEDHKITALVVSDHNKQPKAVVHLHHLLQAGII